MGKNFDAAIKEVRELRLRNEQQAHKEKEYNLLSSLVEKRIIRVRECSYGDKYDIILDNGFILRVGSIEVR